MCRRGWVAIGEWNGLTVLDYICHVIGAKLRGRKGLFISVTGLLDDRFEM